MLARTPPQSNAFRSNPLQPAKRLSKWGAVFGLLLASASFAETDAVVIGEATGDLDRDGRADRVVVLEFGESGDLGRLRTLLVYRNQPGWPLWMHNSTVVMPSQYGGMMGDPFESIAIERGAIVITHYGGSRLRWHYTHRYRFQDNTWKVIGATIDNIDPCQSSTRFDYNLSTGGAEYRTGSDYCEGDNPANSYTVTTPLKLARPSLDMAGFKPGENEVKVPKLNQSMGY